MRDVTGFFAAVLAYEIELWTALDGAVRSAHGVSLGRLQALRVVGARDGKARVQDVAGDLGITVGAASKLVDRLEREDTVRRRPNPGDRRSSLVDLTPSGHRLLEEGGATLEGALRDRIPPELVSDEDLAVVTATLQRLRDHLSGDTRQEVDA